MSLRRQLNAEGIRHANADSPTHDRHVEERAKSRQVSWIAEPVADPNPASVFRLRTEGLCLPKGLYFAGVDEQEKGVSGSDFETHLSAANWIRRFHYSPMKRGDKTCMVRRKASGPAIGETIINLSPWQMTWINGQLERWEMAGVSAEDRKNMLTAFLQPLRQEVVKAFQRETGRDCIGSYLHFDSNKIHAGIVSSRTNGQNQLVGEKYLRTVGPWSVAQHRISQIGAGQPGDARLTDNLERFRARHGDRIPLDIQLHAVIDRKFTELVGKMGAEEQKSFDKAKEQYRTWKDKSRKEAVLRSPSSQRVAFDVIRLITPLFPPQIQATLRLAHTAVQVIQVVSAALQAVAPAEVSASKGQKREFERVL